MAKQRKKIAILAPVGNNIPPKKQGGIEWMVYLTTEYLVKKGYKILLFAPRSTKTTAKLIPVGPKPMTEYKMLPHYERSRKMRIEMSILSNMRYELFKRKNEIGVILNHTVSGGWFADIEKKLNIPAFHILHLPLFKELAEVFSKYKTRLISISNSQRKEFPNLNYATTIYNGIEVEKFPFSKKRGKYLIFCGKIISSKNPLGAIQVAKLTKEKLILIGRINDQEYFQKQIKPHLNKNIVYLGEVSYQKVKTLFSGAKALLFPIEWEEAFGLVMIESMACGTPVIAFNRGAVPEVVKDKVTGFIVKNVKEMAHAVKKLETINREDCRRWVKENFTAEKMAENYETLCRKYVI